MTVKMALSVKSFWLVLLFSVYLGSVNRCQCLKMHQMAGSKVGNVDKFDRSNVIGQSVDVSPNMHRQDGRRSNVVQGPFAMQFPIQEDAGSLRDREKATQSTDRLLWKKDTASSNLNSNYKMSSYFPQSSVRLINVGDSSPMQFKPGDSPAPFKLPTLKGDLIYPGPNLNSSTPILFHAFTMESGFLECLWNCSKSIEDLIMNSPLNIHYVFMSHSENAYIDSLWMRARFSNSSVELEQNKL